MTNEVALDWKKAMAAQTTQAAAEQDEGGIPQVSMRHGRMKLNDEPIPGDNMDVLILDSTYERTWYDRAFDADDKAPPECFALASNKYQMYPHDNVPTPPSNQCKGCPMAEFGTALQGKGPACKTRLRLLVMPAPVNLTPDMILSDATELAIVKVFPTSVVNWDGKGGRGKEPGYVKQLALDALAPWGVVTNIAVAPHDKKMNEVTFKLVRPLGDDALMAAAFQKVNRAQEEGWLHNAWTYDEEDSDDAEASVSEEGMRY